MNNDNQHRALRAAAETWRFDAERELQLAEAAADPQYFGRLKPIERAALARYRDGKNAVATLGDSDSEVSQSVLKQTANTFQLDLETEQLLAEIAVNPLRQYELSESRQIALARYKQAKAAAVAMGFVK